MVSNFDRPTCALLRAEIEKALEAVAKKNGIQIRPKSGTYDGNALVLQIECAVIQDGTVMTREATYFVNFATLYGFEPSDLGREFTKGSEKYRLDGLKTGASRFPILATRLRDGKRFKMEKNSVLLALGRKTVPEFEGLDDWTNEAEARVS